MPLTVLHMQNAKNGGQYRKTLQYGYDRQQGIDRWMGQKLNGLDSWKITIQEQQECYDDMYACALLPPHHSLPIRI